MDERDHHEGRWAKSLSSKPCEICGQSAGPTFDGKWRCEAHWTTLPAMSDWSKQFTTSHPCHVCGETSVAVEDAGWVCETHRMSEIERRHRAWFSRRWFCAVCGAPKALTISRYGVHACRKHRTARRAEVRYDWKTGHMLDQPITPTNHLNGTGLHVEMLGALTDHDLAEQIAYYEHGRDTTESERGKWSWGKMLSTALSVQERRHVTSS